MIGRRWSDGLHQAVEAKEGVRVKEENQTVASITFQNYFRMYKKLAGMTGTADTEAYEFQTIYGLEVVVIPTHMPMIRDDAPDLVYLTQKDKFDAIIEDIRDCNTRGQPVLVGTTSIETSEFLSGLLKKQKIPHQVLNAKFHEREAEIIMQAGRPGTVTIATNMAGRGTDIKLGGNLEAERAKLEAPADADIAALEEDWTQRHAKVIEMGGLHIVGTERHESRRIDNQLRGRSGRQGDPGSSRFYLSLEDNLMRIFGDPERIKRMLSRAGMKEGESIESKLLSRQIERAQRKVEAHNFDIRKQLLEYDDVANDQRRVIYQQRNELLESADVAETVRNMIRGQMEDTAKLHVPPETLEEQWDVSGLTTTLAAEYQIHAPIADWIKSDSELTDDMLRDRVVELALKTWQDREARYGAELMRQIERSLMLQFLDHHWREHLGSLDHLRQGIHLRGYAQKNPKQEYKRESFELFSEMLDRIKQDVVKLVLTVQLRSEEDLQAVEEQESVSNVKYQHAGYDEALAAPADDGDVAVATAPPFTRVGEKVGRNDPCPCGSGKKYKHCHGKF